MSNFRIDSIESALEAAQQYSDLGLPMPLDLCAYLESFGVILTDGSYVDDEEIDNMYSTLDTTEL